MDKLTRSQSFAKLNGTFLVYSLDGFYTSFPATLDAAVLDLMEQRTTNIEKQFSILDPEGYIISSLTIKSVVTRLVASVS